MSFSSELTPKLKEDSATISIDDLDKKLWKAAKIYTNYQYRPEPDVQVLIKRCQKNCVERKELKGTARKLLYQSMGDVLTLTGMAIRFPAVLKQIEEAAKAAGIPQTKGTPTALLVVRLCIGGTDATASQQAQAINGALLKGITGEELPKRLPKQGIAKLAEFYRAEERKDKAANGNVAKASKPKPKPDALPIKIGFTNQALRQLERAERRGIYHLEMSGRRAANGDLEISCVRLLRGRK